MDYIARIIATALLLACASAATAYLVTKDDEPHGTVTIGEPVVVAWKPSVTGFYKTGPTDYVIISDGSLELNACIDALIDVVEEKQRHSALWFDAFNDAAYWRKSALSWRSMYFDERAFNDVVREQGFCQ